PESAADDASPGTVILRDLGNLHRLHLLVTRCRHFERGWKVCPQLEAVHPAIPIALGHLLMDYPATCGHPLNVAGRDRAVIADAVAVLHGSRQDVCDCFYSAVGVPRETGQIVLGDVIAEVVEKQKRVEVGCIAEAEGATQVHAGAFNRWLGFNQPLDGSNGHIWSPSRALNPLKSLTSRTPAVLPSTMGHRSEKTARARRWGDGYRARSG